jgi:hypothetical protein
MRTRSTFPGAGLLAAIALIGLPTAPGRTQETTSGQPAGTDVPAFTQEELSQMLAPIALYPDELLSQVLMASTYPLEIVMADRWVKSHRDPRDEKTQEALEAEPWDPSVKSLVNFPDVLSMLSERLEWTQELGDAFIGQQAEVMDTIQTLRAKAQAAGNLESNKEQKVEVVQDGSSGVIVIEQANPDVIYVPAVNPTVVYGAWPYPAYPPYAYYPPGYAVGAAAISFGVGVACGAAWGYAWGHCNWGWGHGDININTNRNINRNTNINRGRYQRDLGYRGGGPGGRDVWQHNPSHRQGVPYRNQAEARKFGGTSVGQAARSREAFRGRAEAGRRELAAGGANQFRGQGIGRQADRGAANRPFGGQAAANRAGAGGSAANRARSSSVGRESAFSGDNRSGSAARASSNRGHSSMSGSRGGGGGRSGGISRGGGGMRGGGGRGGGRR